MISETLEKMRKRGSLTINISDTAIDVKWIVTLGKANSHTHEVKGQGPSMEEALEDTLSNMRQAVSGYQKHLQPLIADFGAAKSVQQSQMIGREQA